MATPNESPKHDLGSCESAMGSARFWDGQAGDVRSDTVLIFAGIVGRL